MIKATRRKVIKMLRSMYMAVLFTYPAISSAFCVVFYSLYTLGPKFSAPYRESAEKIFGFMLTIFPLFHPVLYFFFVVILFIEMFLFYKEIKGFKSKVFIRYLRNKYGKKFLFKKCFIGHIGILVALIHWPFLRYTFSIDPNKDPNKYLAHFLTLYLVYTGLSVLFLEFLRWLYDELFTSLLAVRKIRPRASLV